MGYHWEDAMDSLVSELQVQRRAWRERIAALCAERDNADKTYGNDREWNQFYGAIEALTQVVAEMDHIIAEVNA